MPVIEQHLLNQVVDISEYPAVLVLGQVVEQFGLRIVIHLKTLSAGVCWHVHFVDVLFGETAGIVRRLEVWGGGEGWWAAEVVLDSGLVEFLQFFLSLLIFLLYYFGDDVHGVLPGVVVYVGCLNDRTLDLSLDHLGPQCSQALLFQPCVLIQDLLVVILSNALLNW